MKRYFALLCLIAFALSTFTACGGGDNVSHNTDGIIESSQRPSESTQHTTAPTHYQSTEHSGTEETASTEGNGFMEDSTSTEETNPVARSRRGTPRFAFR